MDIKKKNMKQDVPIEKEKFIVLEDKTKIDTKFDYEVGNVIVVNSIYEHECVEVDDSGDEILFKFQYKGVRK